MRFPRAQANVSARTDSGQESNQALKENQRHADDICHRFFEYESEVGQKMMNYLPDQFRGELNPDERIIWSGRPQQGLTLRAADIFMIPFSLLWGGFAIMWEGGVIASGAPFFFMLWGIPFVGLGLYIIFGRFFVDSAQRSRVYYALTNQRVIILSGLFNQNTKSLDIKQLPEINVSTKANGKGTISFGPSHPMAWMYGGSGFPAMGRYYAPPSFELIDDARSVYQQIKQLQRADG